MLFLLVPSPAQGCSCGKIEDWGFLGPQEISLPANAAGVLWFKPFDRYRPQPPPSENSVAGRITVEKRVQDQFEIVPATVRRADGFSGIFVVAPREGLVVGATYRFSDHGPIREYRNPRWADLARERGSGPHRQVLASVDVDELPASAPLTLEEGDAPEQPLYIAEGNSCGMSARHQALAPVAAYLPSNAQKWQDSLLFRTLVDGEPWAGAGSSCSVIPSGRSWRPLGQEVVYGTCPDPDARGAVPLAFLGQGGPARLLAPARHTVRMEAYLPGTDIVLRSGTLEIDLTCPSTSEPPPPPSPPVPVRRELERRVGLVYATESDSLGQVYSFTLKSRQTVQVSLTGMNRNFDCAVNGSFCSNHEGTRDDSWSGELAVGSHSIRVSPSGGEAGDYTIMAVVYCPPGHFAHEGSCYRYVVPNSPAPAASSDSETSTPPEDDRAPGTAPEVEPPP